MARAFYIAAHSQDYAWLLKKEIERRGHQVTARWIDDSSFARRTDDTARTASAVMDLEDVLAGKDGLILLAETEGHTVPGGKYVEMGYALALGYPVYVIGSRENTLQWHPGVTWFQSVQGFLESLAARDAGASVTGSVT
jgi:hypothetical protein